MIFDIIELGVNHKRIMSPAACLAYNSTTETS